MAFACTGLALAFLRIWDSLAAGINSVVVWSVAVGVVAGFLFSRGLRRKSSIAVDERILKVTTSLFGKRIKQRQTDISTAAWVRGRIIGNYRRQIAVEVGTIGYATTELVRLALRKGKGVREAEMLCARVAASLNIPSKGFKGLA